MAGFNPNEPRDKEGQWTSGAGLATKVGRKLGILDPPRSHKKGATGNSKRGRPSTHGITGDAHTDAVIKATAIKAGVGLASGLASAAIGHGVRKLTGGAADVTAGATTKRGTSPVNASNLEWPLYDGTTPKKPPTSITTHDEKTYKVRFEFGVANKKKRPNFPDGYKKRGDHFGEI